MVGNKTILTWCCEPGIVPGSLHALPHSPQNTTEKDFTDEETGVQRGWLTCSESHSYIEAEPSFNLAQTDPNSCPVHASCCSLLSDPCIYIHFGPWPSSVYVKCSRMSVGLSFPLGDHPFTKDGHQYFLIISDVAATPSEDLPSPTSCVHSGSCVQA